MNLLLFLTALLTSLTGMISGERTAVSRVQATASAVGQTVDAVADASVVVVALSAHRPSAMFHQHILPLPLPRAFALVPAIRLAAEKRRE